MDEILDQIAQMSVGFQNTGQTLPPTRAMTVNLKLQAFLRDNPQHSEMDLHMLAIAPQIYTDRFRALFRFEGDQNVLQFLNKLLQHCTKLDMTGLNTAQFVAGVANYDPGEVSELAFQFNKLAQLLHERGNVEEAFQSCELALSAITHVENGPSAASYGTVLKGLKSSAQSLKDRCSTI